MFTLNCNGQLLVINEPVVMGILNVTPDSFYAGSRVNDPVSAVDQASKMIVDGAAILDIGGQSTRPGSTLVSREEELDRILPVITRIKSTFPEIIISIDTFYAAVAEGAVRAGASIVNDISAGSIDKKMIETVSRLNVPYILMHMPGTPQTMHEHPPYRKIETDVLDHMIGHMEKIQHAGIKDIIIDPGFGFGKNAADNFRLMNFLEVFKILQRPLLAGISRKSFIYKSLGVKAEDALNGTTVLNTAALLKGANILRVHDVKEAVEAVGLVSAILKTKKE